MVSRCHVPVCMDRAVTAGVRWLSIKQSGPMYGSVKPPGCSPALEDGDEKKGYTQRRHNEHGANETVVEYPVGTADPRPEDPPAEP